MLHTRRRLLIDTAKGLGGIALASILHEQGLLAVGKSPLRPNVDPSQPFAARDSHFPAKAKNVLMIFCSGACSPIQRQRYCFSGSVSDRYDGSSGG